MTDITKLRAEMLAGDYSNDPDVLARLMIEIAERAERAERERDEAVERMHAVMDDRNEARQQYEERCAELIPALDEARRERDDARRGALEEAAREVDCGCPTRDAALAAEGKADLWRACHLGTSCNARQAADIRSMKDRAP